MTVCGASALISAPASTSACDSSVTVTSLAVNTSLPCSLRWGSLTPGWAWQTLSARSSSVVSSP